jgi:hypothetical protein
MYHWVDSNQSDLSKNRTFIEGVLPNRGTSPIAVEDLYFFTTDRNTIAQGSAGGVALTSSVGGAFVLQEALGPHSGVGGFQPGTDPPTTITWESRLGASMPGVVIITFFKQAQ